MRSAAFEDWVEEARAVPLVETAQARSPSLRRGGAEFVGPCPACGGTDRFSVSIRKNVWHCRKSGKGGDVIALVEYTESCDFLTAVEILTGRPAPGREAGESEAERQAREAAIRARRQAAVEAAQARAAEAAAFREAERRRAHQIWRLGIAPMPGSAAARYLALRGLAVPADAHLRARADLAYFVTRKQADGRFKPVRLFAGPAMVAAILCPDGRFAGVHCTWVDFAAADGKARILDPKTGELQPAKKVRGSVHGARIELVRHPAPTRLYLGEGIESCLSAYQALERLGSPLAQDAAVWSAVSLGNLAGRALDRERHPFLTANGPNGQTRAQYVPGRAPDPADATIPIPGSVTELWLLGDGDSDPFTTKLALERAAARFARPGLTIRTAWAEPGQDFNTMLRGEAA